MTTWIALLRAINVGGRNRVAMSDLRELFAASGFLRARSLLQSGNVVFRAGSKTGSALERALEQATEQRLGLGVDYVVRSAEEWQDVVARVPLAAEARRDPGHLVVMFMKDAPKAKDVAALQAAIRGPEVVRCVGREFYIAYPAGIGTSKLTGAVIERTLGMRGTARNWNTVLKLAALSQE